MYFLNPSDYLQVKYEAIFYITITQHIIIYICFMFYVYRKLYLYTLTTQKRINIQRAKKKNKTIKLHHHIHNILIYLFTLNMT